MVISVHGKAEMKLVVSRRGAVRSWRHKPVSSELNPPGHKGTVG